MTVCGSKKIPQNENQVNDILALHTQIVIEDEEDMVYEGEYEPVDEMEQETVVLENVEEPREDGRSPLKLAGPCIACCSTAAVMGYSHGSSLHVVFCKKCSTGHDHESLGCPACHAATGPPLTVFDATMQVCF